MSIVAVHVILEVVALCLLAVVFYLMSRPTPTRIFTKTWAIEHARREMRAEERRAKWLFLFLLLALCVCLALCAKIIFP